MQQRIGLEKKKKTGTGAATVRGFLWQQEQNLEMTVRCLCGQYMISAGISAAQLISSSDINSSEKNQFSDISEMSA